MVIHHGQVLSIVHNYILFMTASTGILLTPASPEAHE